MQADPIKEHESKTAAV